MARTRKRISLLSLLLSASAYADKVEDISRSNGFNYPFDLFIEIHPIQTRISGRSRTQVAITCFTVREGS